MSDKPHYWCGDRNQSDIWEYNKPQHNDLHPTMKPVELVERAINNSSKVGEIVLDGFGGSGSTLNAYSIYEGSDFDIEKALAEAYAAIPTLEIQKLVDIANFKPINRL